MEPHHTRRKKNSTKVNLTISIIFHALIVFLLAFWAAHEGVFGAALKEITVALVPKEKPPEPPKPPPPPPRIEPPKDEPKPEPPKVVEAPPPVQTTAPPPSSAPVAVAPAAAALPDFAFDDGAKVVETGTNAAVAYYRNSVEYALRSNWEPPTDEAPSNCVTEVEIHVDSAGHITKSEWKRGSGNQKWDDSVRKALASTTSINRVPPKDFPPAFIVRFDMMAATEPLLQ